MQGKRAGIGMRRGLISGIVAGLGTLGAIVMVIVALAPPPQGSGTAAPAPPPPVVSEGPAAPPPVIAAPDAAAVVRGTAGDDPPRPEASAALARAAPGTPAPAAVEPPAPAVDAAPAAVPPARAARPDPAPAAPDRVAAPAVPPPVATLAAPGAARAAAAPAEAPAPRPEAGAVAALPAPPVAQDAAPVPPAGSAPPERAASAPPPASAAAEAAPVADRITPPPPAPARPTPGFAGLRPGTQTGRLPQIGTGAPASAGAAGEAVAPAALPAWRRNARPFDNPASKPPFAIILFDDGAAGVDRAALGAGPLPITLAIDMAAPGAAERAAAWRAAGQEVLIVGAALPPGAAPADVERMVEALAGAAPGAVGLIDPPLGGVQDDRAAAAMLLAALAPRGLGLVTWDRGLNSADRIARRAVLPAAVVFRDLEAAGADPQSIRRMLDRAAFRAAQEGGVAVAGRLRPATVATILSWAMEPRAATVAFAPVSALFARP